MAQARACPICSIAGPGIYYDNTAELVHLAGKNPQETSGFALLRGWGANPITDLLQALSVVPHRQLCPDQYLQYMDQVLPSGSDVVFGGKAAHLGQVGSPSGRTLAADPVIGELARCLGNVVAASIFTGAGITEEPTEVAAGVSQPASGTATAHAVVCVAWPSQATAAKYAANVRKALSTELSYEYDQPYSVMLPNATVTSIGGSQHVMQWQADTPGGADTVLQMATSIDLPALPDCNLPSAGKVLVIGCT